MNILSSVPSEYLGLSSALAVLVLLTEFAMLRVQFSRSQVKLYAIQSAIVTVLAVFIAVERDIPGLFIVAIISLILKVIAIPKIVMRLLDQTKVELVSSHRISVPSMILLALLLGAVGMFVIDRLPFHSHSLPTSGLSVSMAVILVSFLLVIFRSDVVSQAVGFFSLENGVSMASLVVAAGLPLVVETAFFFDLLVAVVVFGVLMRVHHQRTSTLSTEGLNRLRG